MKSHPYYSVIRRTIKLAAPLAGSRAIIMLQNFIGMLMIAQLGKLELAAGALIGAAQMTVIVTAMSMLFSISVVISRAYGEGDLHKAGSIAQQAVLLSIAVALPTMLILYFAPEILILSHQPKNIVDLLRSYFHFYAWGIIPMFCIITSQQFFQAILKQKIILILSLTGLATFVILAYCFIFGKFGFHKFGVSGLGLAYMSTMWIGLVLYLSIFVFNKTLEPYQLFKLRIKNNYQHLKLLFQIGWPIAVHTCGELSALYLTTMMTGWLGSTELAARQIINQYILLLIVPIFAIAQSSGVLVGHSLGSKNYDDVARFGYTSMAIGVFVALVASIFFIGFPNTLIHLFVHHYAQSSARLIQLTATLFIIYAIAQYFDAIGDICTGTLRGLYDTKFPMVIGILASWAIGIPCAYLFGFVLKGGVVGLSLARGVGVLFLAVVLMMRWVKKYRSCQLRVDSNVQHA